MKKNILFVLIALTLVAAIATLAVMMQPETVAAEGKIGQILLQLEAADAVQVANEAQAEEYLRQGIITESYESASSGYRYVFDAEQERLLAIRALAETTGASEEALGAEKLSMIAETLTGGLMKEELIGDLELKSARDTGVYMLYTFEETLERIPTGTSAMLFLHYDGTPIAASFIYGSVFEKNEDGAYVLSGESGMISEAEAIEAATAAVRANEKYAQLELTLEGCELWAWKEEVAYKVTFSFPCDLCEEDHSRSCIQQIDAYTGEPGYLAVTR